MGERLSRSQLESLIVARAVVFGDPQLFLVALDRSRVSPAVFAILGRMADRNLPDEQCAPQTKGQRELADRVCAVTVWDLMRTSVHELIAQSKALPLIARPRMSALDVGAAEVA